MHRALVAFLLFALVVGRLQSAEPTRTLSLVGDRDVGRATKHGVETLQAALRAAGWDTRTVGHAEISDRGLILAGTVSSNGPAAQALRAANVPLPSLPEALVVRKLVRGGKPALVLCGADDRGLMYALLDAADRVTWATDPARDPFAMVRDTSESPFIRDRSLSVYTMNRAHWESRFYDERYWTRYFDTLAANRFNRFLIVFGYENGGFLAPPYPYFFDTPGFPGVKMVGLTAEQQHSNLAALLRLIELAHDRGLAVSLGIWDHIYRGAVQTGGAEWLNEYRGQPVPNSVEGVTSQNLNAYTLAALKELLVRLPGIDGLQFRVHEESGLKREEMDGFWREVFAHVQQQKPGLLIEARAKGTPDSVIDAALAQGVNFRIETKYWMEQMGLPYHPTHINPPNQHDRRHGYADLLRQPPRYPISWRLWNAGTSRILLWADPEYVRRYSESARLLGSPNWDVQEPLATKMEAQRPDLPVFDLMPEKYRHYDYEFERYWHFFQTWGRLGYDPDTPAEVWQREFRRRFGAAAPHVETGLHRASQVLPMIVAAVYPYRLFPTTRGWAERQSLGANLAAYAKNEGTDTEQFETFVDAARRIVAGGTTTKRTPDITSRWFDATASGILDSVRAAEAMIGDRRNREFDATIADLRILAQLARFHARRTIGAVHFNLFTRSLKLAELYAATMEEQKAVAIWRDLVAIAGDRYHFDLAMGARDHDLCGHWRDELKKLEAGLKALEEQCCPPDEAILKAPVWQPATADPPRFVIATKHEPPDVRAGQPLAISIRVTEPAEIASVRLRYRHVTQFEDYATLEMSPGRERGEFTVTIPGKFIVPEWSLMYFFEVNGKDGRGMNHPDLMRGAPYVIVKVARP